MRPLLALVALLPGCYASHALEGEAPAACELTYEAELGEARCHIALDSPDACRETAACLCEAAVLPGSATSSERECFEEWLLPRALVTLSDFCASSAGGEPRSLAEAVERFAELQGARVSASPACDRVEARLRL